MKIRLQQADIHLDLSLQVDEVTTELLSQLPLTLRIEDFHATEKIAYLPRKLAAAAGQPGFAPRPGDLA